jgi:hypothetical protein
VTRTSAAGIRKQNLIGSLIRIPSGTLQRRCSCGQHTNGGTCTACGEATSPADVEAALRSPSMPLEPATRAHMESRFDQDFAGVRVHTGSQASESASSMNSLAYTVGQDLVFGPGQYATKTGVGQRLLAHELAHVVQQGNRPATLGSGLTFDHVNSPAEHEAERIANTVTNVNARPGIRQQSSVIQRQAAPGNAAAATEEKADHTLPRLMVELSGVHFYWPEPLALPAGSGRQEIVKPILRLLLGPLFQPNEYLEETILDEVENRKPADLPPVEWSGQLEPGYITKRGETIKTVFLGATVAKILIGILKEKHQKLTLSPQQEELIQLGHAGYKLWLQISKELLRQAPWYTKFLFDREMAQNADLLRQFDKASGSAAQKSVGDSAVKVIMVPVKVMEALRQDPALAADPKAGASYQAIWDMPLIRIGSRQVVPSPTRPRTEAVAAGFLGYVRTQEQLANRALTDHAARVTLLYNFQGFIKTVTSAVLGDEKLADTPARANTPAFPFEMNSSPELKPPLFEASQESDVLFSMKLEGSDIFDYALSYGFSWEQLLVPAHKLPKHEQSDESASKESILGKEAETLKAAGKALKDVGEQEKTDPNKLNKRYKTAGQKATGRELAGQRFARANRYAAEDIKKLVVDSGYDPGIAPLTLVGANSLLRYLGTGARLGVELVTDPRGALMGSKRVTFRTPGIYLVRCQAFPIPRGDETPIVRAPSVAYLPVFARDPRGYCSHRCRICCP